MDGPEYARSSLLLGNSSPRLLCLVIAAFAALACEGDKQPKTPAEYAATPQRVIGLPAAAVEVAMAHTGGNYCVRLVSGQVYCWGPVLDSVDSKGYWSTPVVMDLSESAKKLGSHRSIIVMLSSTNLATIYMGQIGSLSVPEGEFVSELSEVEDDDEVVRYKSGKFGSTATTPSSFHVKDAPPGIIQFAGGGGVVGIGLSVFEDGSVICRDTWRCAETEIIEDRYGSGPTLPGAPKAKYVTLGCLIGTDGLVYCWGRNGWGERGIGAIPWFDGNWLPALNITNAVKVLAREDARHRCALTQEGDLWCWGANYFGQVGNGKVNEAPANKCEEHSFGFSCPGVYTPVKVMSDVKDFAISYDVTCAVKTNGDVYCWGSQRLGQLGNGVEVE